MGMLGRNPLSLGLQFLVPKEVWRGFTEGVCQGRSLFPSPGSSSSLGSW